MSSATHWRHVGTTRGHPHCVPRIAGRNHGRRWPASAVGGGVDCPGGTSHKRSAGGPRRTVAGHLGHPGALDLLLLTLIVGNAAAMSLLPGGSSDGALALSALNLG